MMIVRINGIEYQVKKARYVDVNGSIDNWGSCSFKEQTIEISENLGYDRQVHTMWHELVHAILYEYGIREFINEDKEELVCNLFASGIIGILKKYDLDKFYEDE